MESGTLLPTWGCAPAGAGCDGEVASPWLTICSCFGVRSARAVPVVGLGAFWPAATPMLLKIATVIAPARVSLLMVASSCAEGFRLVTLLERNRRANRVAIWIDKG